MKTPYRCSISLKNTVTVVRIRPTPMVNITKSTVGTAARRMYGVKGAFVTIITATKMINESRKVTRLEKVIPKVNIYFGTYNFLMVPALLYMGRKDPEVEDANKLNTNRPVKR